ncbi:hypothetical protein D7B12_17790 [Salmonella enterica]|nr:hypothetical protein [Salmonella enterica]
MAVNADASGIVRGKFTIPQKIKAGTKAVTFKGNKGSHGESTFTGQGTVVVNTMRKVNNIQQSYYDPLAQTFIMPETRQISGVNIWVTTVGTTDLIVQLRETTVGFPSREIVAEGRVSPANIVRDGWTKVNFDVPFYAAANIEYAVVILANDATMAVAISELGKVDITSKSYVTQQPYQVGVLLSSANASTWTAHQDKDLTFQLLVRRYDPNKPKSVILGNITVPPGTTDFLVSALTNTPATGADAELELIALNSSGVKDVNKTSLTVSDGQVVKLAQETSGNFEVRANLRCTETASATIDPGSQIIAGALGKEGVYVTRSFPAPQNAPYKINVTLECSIQTGFTLEYTIPQTGKPFTWTAIAMTGAKEPLSNGHFEFTGTANVAQAAALSDLVKLRITLKGQANSRPQIFNLRASVV